MKRVIAVLVLGAALLYGVMRADAADQTDATAALVERLQPMQQLQGWIDLLFPGNGSFRLEFRVS